MVKAKKAVARERSPVPANEIVKKTPKPRSRSGQSKTRKAPVRSKSRSKKGTDSEVRGRSRTRSRSRSRSRSKSPKRRGRPRSRSRSHSRSTRRPSRARTARSKSRSKNKKSNAAIDDLIDVVQQRKPSLMLKDVGFGDYSRDSKLNEIIRRSVSRELSQEKTNSYRISSHMSLLTNLKEGEGKGMDGLSQDVRKSVTLPQKRHTWSFSVPGWFRASCGLLLPPVIVLAMHLACKNNQCNLSKFRISRNLKYYFSYEAAGLLVGFVLLQAILSLLPIGKRVDGPSGASGNIQYRCNGLLCTFLTLSIAAGFWHYGFPVTIIYDKLMALIVSSIALAYILGFILFVKGGKAPVPKLNAASIIGSKLHQFYVGRELNPFFFGKINVKTLLIRTCFNGMLLINCILALKSYESRKELSYALSANLGMNALLVIDFFWFENCFPTTFQAMHDGTGCSIILTDLLYPFLPAIITKYIILQKVDLPISGLIGIAIGFTIGFIIYRASNIQKAAFSKYPLNAAFSQCVVIPTNRGKKLLASGWWGRIRHPNYLGSIILHWAWASTSGFGCALPYFVPLIVTIYLVHRAKRVDAFCCQRYQSAWEDYCKQVPYKIFPYIY